MRNVLEWLEASAASFGDKAAFSDVAGELTFSQLEARSRAVGSRLAASLDARTPVALYLEKSCTALCGMFGAVYAGCFYCVIDVRQPRRRVLDIVQTLQPGIVLTDAAHAAKARELFSGCAFTVACIEDAACAATDDELLACRRAGALDIDPLYVNFTSGSTGTPKGVVVGHASVIDFIGQFTRLFSFTPDEQIANQAPFDFDVSVKDIYSGLACGATVHLIPREYFSEPVKLMDFLVERGATVCTWAVSAMCFVSIMNGFDYKVPSTIRTVIFSGEVMPPKQLAKWRAALPDALFANVYGPTEITCNCTYYIVDRAFSPDETIPMGRPFPNERVFLLGEDGREVREPGVSGEVCVGGTTLALGYYADAQATAAAFVPDPTGGRWRETVYRTGDLARYDEDGQLVYVSRKDHQVKHLGQRIELGEIDAAAQAARGVTRACCIYNERRKRLVLFFTGDAEKEGLLAELRERLPQYMVPNKTRHLEAMPMTKNGKIDRAALAAQA